MTSGINYTYEQLVNILPPRPIISDEQYWVVASRVDDLIDKGELSTDEQDYLTALGMMIERYEEERESNIELRGIALVLALMEEQGLRQRDLVKPIFKTDSIASAVLHGKRRLTVEHIDKLAQFFRLPHMLFFETAEEQKTEQTADIRHKPISPPTKQLYNPFVEFIELDLNDKWRQTPPSKQ
ncbi:MAG: hypothetical protein R3E31_27220, partial [Chloroflexota bacterium]